MGPSFCIANYGIIQGIDGLSLVTMNHHVHQDSLRQCTMWELE